MFLGYKYFHRLAIRVSEKYVVMMGEEVILVFVENCEYKDDQEF